MRTDRISEMTTVPMQRKSAEYQPVHFTRRGKIAGLILSTLLTGGIAAEKAQQSGLSADKVFNGPAEIYITEGGDSNWGIAAQVKANVGDTESSIEEYKEKVFEQTGTNDLLPNMQLMLPTAADVDPVQAGVQLNKPE